MAELNKKTVQRMIEMAANSRSRKPGGYTADQLIMLETAFWGIFEEILTEMKDRAPECGDGSPLEITLNWEIRVQKPEESEKSEGTKESEDDIPAVNVNIGFGPHTIPC